MTSATSLCAAITLDAVAGDPQSVPHPVTFIAQLAQSHERMLRVPEESPSSQRISGILAWAGVVGCTAVATWMLQRFTQRVDRRFAALLDIVILASTLSLGSLLDHVNAVVHALEKHDLQAARATLARIVGRDTQKLDAPEICRAAIETLAESLCDGIVAPLCYAAAGGPVAAMSYKAVNTLDSLFGHIEPPYTYFGWCSARADDLANFLPARISAFAIIATSQVLEKNGKRALKTYLADRHRHRSPNAGQCEAAMAGALQVRLGGTNTYEGAASSTPYLGVEYASPGLEDVRRAIRIITIATVLCYGVALVFARR